MSRLRRCRYFPATGDILAMMIAGTTAALAAQVEAALVARRQLLPGGFAPRTAAARIAACYSERADWRVGVLDRAGALDRQ